MGFLQALTSEPLSYSSGNYPQAVGDQAHLVQEDSPPSQAALHPEPEHGPEAVHLLFGKAVLGVIRRPGWRTQGQCQMILRVIIRGSWWNLPGWR
jgi:hypothetical protein